MHLVHLCDLRRVLPGTNALRERNTEREVFAQDIPCTYIVRTHKAVGMDKAELVQVNEDRFYFAIDADVKKGDELTNVRNRAGTTVSSGKFQVEGVDPRRGVYTGGQFLDVRTKKAG